MTFQIPIRSIESLPDSVQVCFTVAGPGRSIRRLSGKRNSGQQDGGQRRAYHCNCRKSQAISHCVFNDPNSTPEFLYCRHFWAHIIQTFI
jgi:hypothetical protein